jgi:HlyD family secretion protein
MKKLILPLVLVVLAVGGYLFYRNYTAAPSNVISVSGNIELEQVNIGFKTSGKVIERTVNEGDNVTKGEVIARLDRDQLVRQREREMASLQEAEANLAETKTGVAMSTESVAADLDGRKADADTAESKLKELKNGSRPQEITQATEAVASAQAEYDRAKKDWERSQKLHSDDDISTSQYDMAQRTFLSAESSLKQAKDHEALMKEGSRSEDVDQAQAQLIRAKAAIRGSQANELDIKRRQQDVVAKQADIEREQAQIALIDAQLADTTASSPIAGVVLVKSVDVGEVIAPGTAVVTVGDLDHPWLRAYIPETDLGRVKLGAKVDVKTDSFPGRIFNGRVTFISSEAEFTPKQIETKDERVKLVYRIKIEIDNPQHELKSNMPADAEIHVN